MLYLRDFHIQTNFYILIVQIIPSIGGIPKQSTRKFLADGQEVSEEDPKITDENVAQYYIVLYCGPSRQWIHQVSWISSIIRSIDSYFLIFSALGEPSFKHLADVETPSGLTSILSSSGLTQSESRSDGSDTSQLSTATNDVLNSTAIDGISFFGAFLEPLDVSNIVNEFLFFMTYFFICLDNK